MKYSRANDSDPPVSVIMPCYNHGRFIREAIKTVEQCDPTLYELIIIDDGSTDGITQRVLGELEAEGYRVMHQENQGPAASRNAGIAVARGRYILPLDSDNKIYPNYLTVGIDVLDRQPEVGVVYARPELFGDISARRYPAVGAFDLRQMVLGNYIDACAVIRKSAILECGLYDTQMPFYGWEDWDLWLTMATRGWQFHFADAKLFSYRIVRDSTVSVARKPEQTRINTEYLCRKHALLLRQVIIEQQQEISDHPRALRYARLWAEQGLRAVVQEGLVEAARRLKVSATSRFRRAF